MDINYLFICIFCVINLAYKEVINRYDEQLYPLILHKVIIIPFKIFKKDIRFNDSN